MPQDHRTHYEILGITRNAKPREIERAYRRLRAQMQSDTTAPDPRHAVLVQTAYEVLSDPARRDGYDQAQRRPLAVLRRARYSKRIRAYLAAGTVGIALVAAGVYFAFRPPDPDRPHDPAEIAQAASLAVGRVQSVDVAGAVKPLGLAFAVQQGALATSCEGLTPGSQLVVSFAQRKVPARVATIYGKDGVCRLTAEGMGSWPLTIASRIPPIGARVFATQVGANGQVSLVPGEVRHVIGDEGIITIMVDGPAARQPAGGPLLDVQGRVIGVGAGPGTYRPVPNAWLAEMNLPPEVPHDQFTPAPKGPMKAPIELQTEKAAHERAEQLHYLDNLK